MKPPTVFLGEMTNPEVEAFLKTGHTVIVPTGATEQHGPAWASADRRAHPAGGGAPRRAAASARWSPRRSTTRLSYPHVGFTGLVHIRIPTFMALIEDLCASFAASGFRRIIFLNGHYDNTYAIAYGCANAWERMPKGVKAFPINYWDGLTAEEVAEFSGLKNGLHANAAETSAVLAINPALVDMERANAEFPPFPEFTVNTGAGAHRVLLHLTGLGVSGDEIRARGATRAGRRPKSASGICKPGVRSTLAVLENIEKTFAAMPPR